ncbi:hypothetical protein ACFQ0T_42735 [Kitasatospora gansuensis]
MRLTPMGRAKPLSHAPPPWGFRTTSGHVPGTDPAGFEAEATSGRTGKADRLFEEVKASYRSGRPPGAVLRPRSAAPGRRPDRSRKPRCRH